MAHDTQREMRADYDADQDVLYIHAEDAIVKESIEVQEDVVIDVDKHGALAGIEIFDAHQLLHTLNGAITKEALKGLDLVGVKAINYRNYVIVTLLLHIGGAIIEEKLPAFSLTKYDSPLVASAA